MRTKRSFIKKPWVFLIDDLQLKVREVGRSKYIDILELDPQTGDIISKVLEPNSGKTLDMEFIILEYLTQKRMNLEHISNFEKILIIKKIFEDAHGDHTHFCAD